MLSWALAALLVVAVLTTFAPWLRTGEARRSAHGVVRAADRLEVLEPGPRVASRVAWATLPLVASSALLALALDRRGLAAALALWVALIEGTLAYALTQVPEVADGGARTSLAVAAMLVAVSAAVLIDRGHGWRAAS